MKKDSILQNFYYSKLPKAKVGLRVNNDQPCFDKDGYMIPCENIPTNVVMVDDYSDPRLNEYFDQRNSETNARYFWNNMKSSFKDRPIVTPKEYSDALHNVINKNPLDPNRLKSLQYDKKNLITTIKGTKNQYQDAGLGHWWDPTKHGGLATPHNTYYADSPKERYIIKAEEKKLDLGDYEQRIRTLRNPNTIQLPAAKNKYRVEYFDPKLNKETHKLFPTQEASDLFVQELSKRDLGVGVPAMGNITQRVEYATGGQLSKAKKGLNVNDPTKCGPKQIYLEGVGCIDIGSKMYQDLYNAGKLGQRDAEGNLVTWLPEVTVNSKLTAEQKHAYYRRLIQQDAIQNAFENQATIGSVKEQPLYKRTWDLATHPFTAIRSYNKMGYVPSNLGAVADQDDFGANMLNTLSPAVWARGLYGTGKQLLTHPVQTPIDVVQGAGNLLGWGLNKIDSPLPGQIKPEYVSPFGDAGTNTRALEFLENVGDAAGFLDFAPVGSFGRILNIPEKIIQHPLVYTIPSVFKNKAYAPYKQALLFASLDNAGKVASKVPGLSNLYKKGADAVASWSAGAFRSPEQLQAIFNNFIKGKIERKYTGVVGGVKNQTLRNLIKNYIYGDARGFDVTDLEIQGLEKYDKIYGPLKKYQLDKGILGDQPINFQEFIKRPKNSEALEDLNIITQDMTDLEKYNALNNYLKKNSEGFSIQSDYNMIGNDDIAGNLIFLKHDPITDGVKLKTQDIWKFTPDEYAGSYSGGMPDRSFNIKDPINLKTYLEKYVKYKQAALMDRSGKPFVLLDERPMIFGKAKEDNIFTLELNNDELKEALKELAIKIDPETLKSYDDLLIESYAKKARNKKEYGGMIEDPPTDERSQEFYNKLKSYYTAPERTEKEKAQYDAFLKFNEKHGYAPVALKSKTISGNPMINPFTGRLNLIDYNFLKWSGEPVDNSPHLLDTYMSEYPHYMQYNSHPNQSKFRKSLRFIGKWAKDFGKMLQNTRGLNFEEAYLQNYATPGTVEHDAHGVIEPNIRKEFDQYTQEYLTNSKSKGGIIEDNRGQWDHPGKITKIQGNTMATHGYGNIPLYVIPNGDKPRVVLPNTGTQKFPNSTSFTEIPMAQDGLITPDQEKAAQILQTSYDNQRANTLSWLEGRKKNPRFTQIASDLIQDVNQTPEQVPYEFEDINRLLASDAIASYRPLKNLSKKERKNYPFGKIIIADPNIPYKGKEGTSEQQFEYAHSPFALGHEAKHLFLNTLPKRMKDFTDEEGNKVMSNLSDKFVPFKIIKDKFFEQKPRAGMDDYMNLVGQYNWATDKDELVEVLYDIRKKFEDVIDPAKDTTQEQWEGIYDKLKLEAKELREKAEKTGNYADPDLNRIEQMMKYFNIIQKPYWNYFNNNIVRNKKEDLSTAAYGGPLVDYYAGKMNHGEMFRNGGLVKAPNGVEVTPSPENFNTVPYNLEHFTKYVPEYARTYGAPMKNTGDTYDGMRQNLIQKGVPSQEASNIMSFLNNYYDVSGNLRREPLVDFNRTYFKNQESIDSPEAERRRVERDKIMTKDLIPGIDYKNGGSVREKAIYPTGTKQPLSLNAVMSQNRMDRDNNSYSGGISKFAEGGGIPKMQRAGQVRPPIYTDNPELVRAYRDSSDMKIIGDQLLKLRSFPKLPQISQEEYNRLEEKEGNLTNWGFDQTGYKEDKKKKINKDFSKYIYSRKNKDYEHPLFLKNNKKELDRYTDNVEDFDIILPDGSIKAPLTVYDGKPDWSLGYQIIDTKNGTSRMYEKNSKGKYQLTSMHSKNIKPIETKYYGSDVLVPNGGIDILGTGWYTGKPPDSKLLKKYINYYIPHESTHIYPTPVQPYILKQKPKADVVKKSQSQLKQKVLNVEPILYNIPVVNPGLRPMHDINIESSPVQQNPATVAWNVEYFDPNTKKTEVKIFATNQEAEEFYNNPANRASRKYSDASSVGRFNNGGQANRFYYNKGYGVPRFPLGGGYQSPYTNTYGQYMDPFGGPGHGMPLAPQPQSPQTPTWSQMTIGNPKATSQQPAANTNPPKNDFFSQQTPVKESRDDKATIFGSIAGAAIATGGMIASVDKAFRKKTKDDPCGEGTYWDEKTKKCLPKSQTEKKPEEQVVQQQQQQQDNFQLGKSVGQAMNNDQGIVWNYNPNIQANQIQSPTSAPSYGPTGIDGNPAGVSPANASFGWASSSSSGDGGSSGSSSGSARYGGNIFRSESKSRKYSKFTEGGLTGPEDPYHPLTNPTGYRDKNVLERLKKLPNKEKEYDHEKKLMTRVSPYLRSQMQLAANRNINTGAHNGPLDAIRHAGSSAALATEVFPNWLPFYLKIIGANALGAAHEFTSRGDINLKETGSDLYNNFIGSVIGSLPISKYKKQQMVIDAQNKGILSDLKDNHKNIEDKANGGDISIPQLPTKNSPLLQFYYNNI